MRSSRRLRPIGACPRNTGPVNQCRARVSQETGDRQESGPLRDYGGNPCCEGNVTPAAEYNIWVDPEAARMVLLSGLPVELVGWHLCRGSAVLGPSDIEDTLQIDTDVARFAIHSNSHARHALKVQTGEDGICLPDPVAMCLALDPSVGRNGVRTTLTSRRRVN